MMKSAIFATALLAISLGQFATAGDCHGGKNDAISLQGTVIRQQRESLDENGEIRTAVVYYLQTEDSKTELPVHKNCKGEPKVDFQAYVGRTVTVAARGVKKQTTDGRTLALIRDVAAVRVNPEYESIVLQGTIVREETLKLDKTGEIRTVEVFHLKTSDRRIELPTGRLRRQMVDLRPFAGRAVVLKFRGLQKSNSAGETLSYVHELVDVREMDSASAISSAGV